jgi:hypothetical protein
MKQQFAAITKSETTDSISDMMIKFGFYAFILKEISQLDH